MAESLHFGHIHLVIFLVQLSLTFLGLVFKVVVRVGILELLRYLLYIQITGSNQLNIVFATTSTIGSETSVLTLRRFSGRKTNQIVIIVVVEAGP